MKIIPLILIMFSVFQISFGQTVPTLRDSIVSNINDYMKMIDSDNSLYKGISEGSIVNNGVTGDFSTYSSFSSKTKELYRVYNKEVTDKILIHIFYYQDNKLIYAKAEKKYFQNNKRIIEYTQKLYFDQKQPILEIGNGIEISELREIGLRHLKTHNEIYKKKE